MPNIEHKQKNVCLLQTQKGLVSIVSLTDVGVDVGVLVGVLVDVDVGVYKQGRKAKQASE